MKNNSFKTASFIGLRYLFSKKKHNIINLISIISMVGIMVSSAALIIVLSVFNGMENFVRQSFNSFNSDFQIVKKEGKSFSVDSIPLDELRQLEGVEAVYEVVGDWALITYEKRQQLVAIKGVSDQYIQKRGIDTLLIDGEAILSYDSVPAVILGASVAGMIQLNFRSPAPVEIYYPKRNLKNLSNPATAFNKGRLIPSGVFASYTEYDAQYIFIPIAFAREMMDYENELTSVEIQVKDEKYYSELSDKFTKIIGNQYIVKNKYQQEELLYKTMKSEKLIVFVILAFILIVASFNIIGTLAMLIIEKKEDLRVLTALGANKSLIRRIFLVQGSFVSLLGGMVGLLLGALICFLQQSFHFVKLGDGSANYLMNYYPVEMHASDFIIVFITILIISILTSYIPIRQIKKLVLGNK